MPRSRRIALAAGSVVVFGVGLATGARAVGEYELKAAFLLNFVRLVEWPSSAFADGKAPYVIGVFSDDPFEGALDSVLDGERASGRSVRVRRLRVPGEAPGCHLVFVPASQAGHFASLRSVLADSPVLLVAESEDFARRGAVINLFREEGRIRFEVNRSAARRAGLKLSSRLLRLARLVEED